MRSSGTTLILALITLISLPMLASGATGVLEIDLAGPNLKDLQITSVTVQVDSQTQELVASKKKQKLYFYLFPGTYPIRLSAYGKIAFTRQMGQVKISSREQSTLQLDLRDSLATLDLELPPTGSRTTILLFAGQKDTRPLWRFYVPDDGIIPNLAAARMWMVLLDQNGKVIAKKWVKLKSGTSTTVKIRKQDMPEQISLKMLLRSDLPGPGGVDATKVSAGVADSRIIPLAWNGKLYSAEVPPGRTVLEVNYPGFGRVTSDTLFPGYFDNNPSTLLLHLQSSDDFFWCDTAAMLKSKKWSDAAETLENEGRLFDALMLYRLADPCNPDDSTRRSIKDLGQELATLAREQDHMFNRGSALFTREVDSSVCRSRDPHPTGKPGVCLNGDLYHKYPSGGSIEWLTATGNTELLPGEVELFMRHLNPLLNTGQAVLVREFIEREVAVLDSRKVPSLIATLLALEEQAFQAALAENRSGFAAEEQFNDGIEASLIWLREALQWASLSETAVDLIVQRAILRSKSLVSELNCAAIDSALSYSLLADDSETITMVRKRAASLASKAMDQKKIDRARCLLSIAEDEKGMAQLEALELQNDLDQ